MSATPTADLCAYATERGVSLSRRGAQKLLDRLGPVAARERVDMIVALRDLSSAHGRELSQLSAVRRLDAALIDRVYLGVALARRREEAGLRRHEVAARLGTTAERVLSWENGRALPPHLPPVAVALEASFAELQFEAAAARLSGERSAREGAEFVKAWRVLERDFYDRDAHARHAAFLAELDSGSLGHRATLLLLAAADAGLRRPSSAEVRARLWGLCDVEFARRHSVDARARSREEVLAEVASLMPADPIERADWERKVAAVREHTAPAQAAEEAARAMAERQLRNDDGDRDLAITINRLGDFTPFRGDIERELARVRRALAEALAREDAGAWRPDPDQFRRAVIEGAFAKARAARAA